ncbi:MAG TPA: hypothetical protein DEP05_00580 [Betaproteobacteria bacterium]|nr:hypothetical protein [Betaproteobacteria bacterium]
MVSSANDASSGLGGFIDAAVDETTYRHSTNRPRFLNTRRQDASTHSVAKTAVAPAIRGSGAIRSFSGLFKTTI